MISVSYAASKGNNTVLARAAYGPAPLSGGIDITFPASAAKVSIFWTHSICAGSNLPGTVPALGAKSGISDPSKAVEEIQNGILGFRVGLLCDGRRLYRRLC